MRPTESAEDLADLRVGDEPATADDDDAVGDELHLAHEVAGDQDGATLVGEPAEEGADPADAFEVQPVDGLVEEQDGWVAEQGRGDAEALAHPERVALDPPTGGLAEADELDDLLDPVEANAVAAGPDPQVGPPGTARVDGAGVEEGAHLVQWRGERGVRAAADRLRVPDVARSSPSAIRMVVDLPAPLGPRKRSPRPAARRSRGGRRPAPSRSPWSALAPRSWS